MLDPTNWSRVTGRDTIALINAETYREDTVAGEFVIIGIPSGLLTGRTATFSANGQPFVFIQTQTMPLSGFELYTLRKSQGISQSIRWGINIS